MLERTISSYGSVLLNYQFPQATTFSEQFAQERYAKKLELPSKGKKTRLEKHCTRKWLITDLRLPCLKHKLLPHKWYIARKFIHEWLAPYNRWDIRKGDFRWPQGAEFDRFRGTSIEARLSRRSKWSCTHENYENFKHLVLDNRGFRIAVKKRYYRGFSKDQKKAISKVLLHEAKKLGYQPHQYGDYVIGRMLDHEISFCYGSRFSTVPKNNKKRRPINIEPFGNLLCQSQVGLFIRRMLKEQLNYDLDEIANLHRIRISDPLMATIDESDASDSISLDLCRFLFPAWFYKELVSRRSPMVLVEKEESVGWYIPRKLSSMGNGFTFEILTIINLALTRCYDPTATCFGDDIIVNSGVARDVIKDLTAVGFKVNLDKTFIEGPFRESCGGNYHADEGYIESYDFKYPESIGDCVAICNKAARLARIYPSFTQLYQRLVRVTPTALRGGPDQEFLTKEYSDLFTQRWQPGLSAIDLPTYFVTPKFGMECHFGDLRKKFKIGKKVLTELLLMEQCYQITAKALVPTWKFEPLQRTHMNRTMNSNQWAKYLMYVANLAVTKDSIRNRGRWCTKLFVRTEDGRLLQLRSSVR